MTILFEFCLMRIRNKITLNIQNNKSKRKKNSFQFQKNKNQQQNLMNEKNEMNS